MNPEMAMVMKRNEEREALRSVIQQWNANRLDLFELSEPNEVSVNLIYRSILAASLCRVRDYLRTMYLTFTLCMMLR